MCCVFLILVFLGPRAGILLWWLADQARWEAAFDTFLWPFLGFLFLPWTTLMYLLMWSFPGGVSGAEWIIVGLGVVFDLVTYSARSAQTRYATR